MLDQKIKITYVQSPINQISNQLLEEKLSPGRDKVIEQQSPNKYVYNDISQRLQNNLKKIQSIEHRKDDSGKKNINFKMLKNNLVTNTELRKTIDYADRLKEQSMQRQRAEYKYSTPSRRSESFSNKTFSKSKYSSQYMSANHKIHGSSQNKPTNLQGCLKELKQIKRTIKDLKQTCQNGFNNGRKLQTLNSNCIRNIRPERSLKKYSTSSLSKYTYSNYKNLSDQKSNKSQDRLHYSDKKFNWMSNPKVQEYTIDASCEDS